MKAMGVALAFAAVATCALRQSTVQNAGGMRAQDYVPNGLQPEGTPSRLIVNVVTELTDAGRKAAQPSAAAPVTYLGHDGGMVTEGDIIGGERPPAFNLLAGTMEHALAASGFRPAAEGQTPSILIYYRWGSFNRQPRGFPELERVDLVERAALVGGTKFGLDVADAINGGMLNWFSHKDVKTELLMDQAHSDLYFLIASAYDFSAAQQGRRVLLWRTKLSTLSRGVTMGEAIPTAVAEAGKYFGHPTTGSVRVETRVEQGQVQVGQPIVKEYLDAPLPAHFKPDTGDLHPIPASQMPTFPLAR